MSATYAILGGGESGCGAALLAKKLGYNAFVSDIKDIPKVYRDILMKQDIAFEERGHKEENILKADEIIKSPGIPENAPIVLKARERGIPVISEIEFAGRHAKGTKICVTGSNGKTTTSSLIAHILHRAGKDVMLCGNIGKSFAAKLSENQHEYWVIEVSSFQLDGMYDFKAEIAILLNITPDHLDRYDYSFDAYAESKMRIARNQSQSDVFIFNADDDAIRARKDRVPGNAIRLPFTQENQPASSAAWIRQDHPKREKQKMIIKHKSGQLTMTLENLALQGRHNVYNSMAAGIAARVLDIRKDIIKESLSDFKNIEHRLEFVANVHGIEFINDSKATNVNSTWFALESMNKPIVWIVGGVDKGNDYAMLREMVKQKVKAIVCLGKDNKAIRSVFGDLVSTILDTESAQDAVNEAYYLGESGDVVLLSPACASFDLFENYEDRGDQFKMAVKKL